MMKFAMLSLLVGTLHASSGSWSEERKSLEKLLESSLADLRTAHTDCAEARDLLKDELSYLKLKLELARKTQEHQRVQRELARMNQEYQLWVKKEMVPKKQELARKVQEHQLWMKKQELARSLPYQKGDRVESYRVTRNGKSEKTMMARVHSDDRLELSRELTIVFDNGHKFIMKATEASQYVVGFVPLRKILEHERVQRDLARMRQEDTRVKKVMKLKMQKLDRKVQEHQRVQRDLVRMRKETTEKMQLQNKQMKAYRDKLRKQQLAEKKKQLAEKKKQLAKANAAKYFIHA